MFGRDKNKIANEKVLYEARPSFLISCSSILFAMIILGILFYAYTAGIKMVGNMSVFLASSIKTPITSYYALAILVLMIFVFLYIIWKILAWSTVKYKITNYRVIVKKGVITEDKIYMPFNTIQDINVSQSILGKLISVGTLTLYSAYDGKNVELKNIFSPSKVEDIIFENMRNSSLQPRNLYNNQGYTNSNQNYNNSSPLSSAGSVFSRLKEKENEVSTRNMGNIYSSYDEIIPEHNNSMSEGPVNDISDLDDLELVDVKERKKKLRELRKQAKKSNQNHYSNSRNYGSYNGGQNNFDSPYDKVYDSDLDDYEYINGPSHYSKQNQQHGYDNRYSNNQYNPNYQAHNQYNHNYQNNYSNPYPDNYSNQYQDNYSNQRVHHQNHEPDVYVQNISPEGYETYQSVPNESIRDSYRRNPDKYFAENYEKFHEDNMRYNNQEEYEISDAEFDRAVMEANNNLSNKNIMFRGQKSNYPEDSFSNDLINDLSPRDDFRQNNRNNYGDDYRGNYRDNYNSQPNYQNRNYDSNSYRDQNKYDNVAYNNSRNHSKGRRNNRNYNNRNNRNNRNNYNKNNSRYNSNNNYGSNYNRYGSNHSSNNDEYFSDYSTKEDKKSKDVIKNHSRKFNR